MFRKSFALLGLLFFLSCSLSGQEIKGVWEGLLNMPGATIRLGFTIDKDGDNYLSALNSPDQGAIGWPTSSTDFRDGKLSISMVKLAAKYEGNWTNDSIINGNFTQRGQSFSLALKRMSKEIIRKPQEPVKPFPYSTEEVVIENKKDKAKLAGTWSVPEGKGPFPAVVLISGSGLQDRDEAIAGHKPFLLLADHLTRMGIAVLRYDDRGYGKSTGDPTKSTTLDFARDAESVVRFLKSRKEVNKSKIGVIGHSEGAAIAVLLAANLTDIAYLVSMAGNYIPGDELLLLQEEMVFKSQGMDKERVSKILTNNQMIMEFIRREKDNPELFGQVKKMVTSQTMQDSTLEERGGLNVPDFISVKTAQLTNPWMIHFINANPADDLARVNCPVLIINGSRDIQIPAKENLQAAKDVLDKSGNQKYVIKEFTGLNHLFQECKTCTLKEYETLLQTMSPEVLKMISEWVLNQ